MSRQRYVADRILTMDEQTPYVRELVVEADRILAIGDEARDIPCDEVFEMRDGVILPGFIDAHTHFLQMGIKRMQVDLRGTTSIEEALERVAYRIHEVEPGSWVVGNHWDESKWKEQRYITRQDIDRVAPENPVILRRMCGHLWVANTRALEQVEIPPHHQRGLDKANGLLRWESKDYFWPYMQLPTSQLSHALQIASEMALELGVTSVHEWHSDFQTLYAADRSQLSVKVVGGPSSDMLDALCSLQLPIGFGNSYTRLGAVKFFADGSFGARTAALYDPYEDSPHTSGELVWDTDELTKCFTKAHQRGLQIAVHAIGDKGIDVALAAFRKAIDTDPERPHRHRIEHCEMPNRWAIEEIAALGIIVSAQPNFIGEWGLEGGMYQQRLGEERFRFLNPLGTFRRNGIRMAFGSDCMPMNPIYGIWCAARHPVPEEQLHPEQSIRYYTSGSAHAAFEEQEKGKLIPNMAADFIVLSADPTRVPVDQIRDIVVLMTVVDGKQVFV